MTGEMIFNFVFVGLVTISIATPLESFGHTKNEQLYGKTFTDASSENSDIPERIDWREIIPSFPPVYDQGNCNASSYFAVVALIQTHRYITQKINEPLSVQNMVDCGYNLYNLGCQYSEMRSNFGFIFDKGLPLASGYPAYEGIYNECRSSTGELIGKDTLGYWYIPGSEKEMAKIVATKGPIAVSIVNENLPNYTGGVLNDPDCPITYSNDVAQAGLVVGYDTTEDGQEYWIVQFSFGTKWGENGYARIARNVNMCSIAYHPYYVTL